MKMLKAFFDVNSVAVPSFLLIRRRGQGGGRKEKRKKGEKGERAFKK